MDLLASMFAYFGTVAAIIFAFATCYDVVVNVPLHSTAAPHVLALSAKPSTTKATVSPTGAGRRVVPAARDVPRQAAARITAQAAAAAKLKTERPSNALLRKEVMRRLARQDRPERSSEQPSQALGYAEAPWILFDQGPVH